MSKDKKYIGIIINILRAFQEKLNQKAERMEELTMEDIKKMYEETTQIKNIDLSWIASQQSVDEITTEIASQSELLTSIHTEVTDVKNEVIAVKDELHLTNKSINKIVELLKRQYQIYEGLEMGKEQALAELTYILDDSKDIVKITGIATENDGVVGIYDQYNVEGKVYSTKIASTFSLKSSSISEIAIGDNVDWSEYTSAEYLFYDCNALTTVNLGSNFYKNSKNLTSMKYMFAHCNLSFDEINRIIDPTIFDSSNVTNMSYMFSGHQGLKHIQIPLNISRATSMSNMFAGCLSLLDVRIDTIINEGLNPSIDARSMFENCRKLTNMYLSEEFTTHFNNINEFAKNTFNLQSLELTIDVEKCHNIEAISSSFDDTSKGIKNLILNFIGYRQSSTIYLKNLVCYSNNFTSIKITNADSRNEFDFTNWLKCVSAGSGGVPNIKTVEISGIDNITDVNTIFANITGLTTVILDGFNNLIQTTNDFLGSICKQTLTSAKLSGFANIENLTALFNNCKNIATIEFVNFASNGKITNFYNTFRLCGKLTSIIGFEQLFNTKNIIRMDSMFDSCELLKVEELNFGSANDPKIKVSSMQSAFKKCNSMVHAPFTSRFDTSECLNFGSVFNTCVSLENLDLSTWDFRHASNMNAMFSGTTALTQVLVSRDLWILHESGVTYPIFNNSNCSDVTFVDAA